MSTAKMPGSEGRGSFNLSLIVSLFTFRPCERDGKTAQEFDFLALAKGKQITL